MNKLGMTGIANICFDRIYEAYSNDEISDSEFAFLVESVDDKFEYWYEKFDFGRGKTPNPDKELKDNLNSVIANSSQLMKDLIKYVGGLRKDDNSEELTRYTKDGNMRVPSAEEVSSKDDTVEKLNDSIVALKRFEANRPLGIKFTSELNYALKSLSSAGLISDINSYSTKNGRKGLDGLEKFYWAVNDYKNEVFDKNIRTLQDAKSNMSEYIKLPNKDTNNSVGMALR